MPMQIVMFVELKLKQPFDNQFYDDDDEDFRG